MPEEQHLFPKINLNSKLNFTFCFMHPTKQQSEIDLLTSSYANTKDKNISHALLN